MTRVSAHGLFTLILSFFFLTSLPGEGCPGSVELRYAAFLHTSKTFRDIYGTINQSFQVEASTPLRLHDLPDLWCGLDLWGNFDYSQKQGKSIFAGDYTRVRLSTFSAGLKQSYQIDPTVNGYVGIGPSFAIVSLKNRGFFLNEDFSKSSLGVVLKFGVNYLLTSQIFIDLFIDYLYQPVRYQDDIDVGGFKPGIGIGMLF